MGQIKIKVKLYEGHEGAPLDKLGEIAERCDLFLRSLGKDVGLTIKKGEWIAKNFRDGSVGFDILHAGEYDVDYERAFNRGMHDIAATIIKEKTLNGKYSSETLRYFAGIAEPIGLSEKISFGIYQRGAAEPEALPDLKKIDAVEILSELDKSIEYVGTVYGIINTIFMAARPKYFTLKEFLTQKLISCEFQDTIYSSVIEALERPQGIIYAYGLITSNKVTREVRKVQLERIDLAPELSTEEYKKFFGCAPDITEDHSTEDYIHEKDYE
jgi:hypothetical protein